MHGYFLLFLLSSLFRFFFLPFENNNYGYHIFYFRSCMQPTIEEVRPSGSPRSPEIDYYDHIGVGYNPTASSDHDIIKNYTHDRVNTLIYNKVHHEVNQFCSVPPLQEICVDMFGQIDKDMKNTPQKDRETTEPNIPEPKQNRVNYRLTEAEKSKLSIVVLSEAVIVKEAEMDMKTAIIEDEKVSSARYIQFRKHTTLEKFVYTKIQPFISGFTRYMEELLQVSQLNGGCVCELDAEPVYACEGSFGRYELNTTRYCPSAKKVFIDTGDPEICNTCTFFHRAFPGLPVHISVRLSDRCACLPTCCSNVIIANCMQTSCGSKNITTAPTTYSSSYMPSSFPISTQSTSFSGDSSSTSSSAISTTSYKPSTTASSTSITTTDARTSTSPRSTDIVKSTTDRSSIHPSITTLTHFVTATLSHRPTPAPRKQDNVDPGEAPEEVLGGSFGGAMFIAVGIALTWWCRRRRRQQRQPVTTAPLHLMAPPPNVPLPMPPADDIQMEEASAGYTGLDGSSDDDEDLVSLS